MLTALYYPHTRVKSKALLKNSLLLWDSLECIVPSGDWEDPNPIQEPMYREAAELIITNHVPSDEERSEAHSEVRSLVAEDSRSVIRAAEEDHRAARRDRWRFRRWSRDYLIFDRKFLDSTWWLLQREGYADYDEPTSDWSVPPGLGLMMMSMLASACAGTQKTKVTDQGRAYSWLEETRAEQLGSDYITGLDVSQVAPAYDRLVTLSLEALDARRVPLRRLLAFRKREGKESGADYRAMRRRYLSALARHLTTVGKEARGKSDVDELDRVFKEELKDDLQDLKKELRLADIRSLFSKEVAFSTLAFAGALTEPISGLTTLATTLKGIGVAPLVKARADYRASRRKALRGHTMSWLYLASGSRANQWLKRTAGAGP